MRWLKRTDVVVGIGTILLAAWLLSIGMDVSTGFDPGGLTARFFPILLPAILVLLGLILLLRPGPRTIDEFLPRQAVARVVSFAGLFLIYALSFRHMDFRVGTLVFVLLAMLVLGERRFVYLATVPIAVSLLAFGIFRYGFGVLLPIWT